MLFTDLTTERLLLRQLKMEDANEIFLLRSDEKVNEFLEREKASSIEDAKKFIGKINDGINRHEWMYWGICFKNETKLVGTICLWNISKEKSKAEIGYELLPAFWGKQIISEAVLKITEFAFKMLKLETIEAYTTSKNINSVKILEKNNFKRDMDAENKIDRNNSDSNSVIYLLTNKRYVTL